jgi:leucyl aminopeptidase
MDVRSTTDAPADTGADTIAVGLFQGEGIAHDTQGGELGALVDAGEAKPAFRKVALTHAGGKRWLVAGLGKRDEFDPERARIVAGRVLSRARALGARSLCWELPHHVSDAHAAAFVEGSVMGAYEFTMWKSKADDDDEDGGKGVAELIVSAHHDVAGLVERGRIVGESVNLSRDLQNRPANDLTPTALAERAAEIAAKHDTLTLEVMGRAEIEAAGMGAFAAVAQGTDEEPQLITLRYDGPDAAGPVLGYVGKAVTFDSGGISIKPGNKMSDMKFDMSGGAAVLGAVAAIARLELPVRLIGVVGATENLPSGHSMKPGDILRARNGTTIEVINTDAEGRLVLADCLHHAIEQGAERLVDLATLTGAIVTTLGTTYAGLMGTDDEWCEAVSAAGRRAGEILWRLPLHPEYADLIKGRYGDILNAVENRRAASVTAAEFLKRFVGDTPWVHLDIAGTAWDTGKAYAPKGGNGYGVRLLVELASTLDGERA